MRIRIGYGGPKNYKHGQYFPGGARNNGGMSEIERLIHLIASMQILFGSRRGGWLIPILFLGLCFGGWYLYRTNFSPESALEQAHKMWDSNDTKQQIQAIKKYQAILQKSDPMDPSRRWLKDDRDTLYRRIIVHEFKFQGNEEKAAEWIQQAWDEGIRDLRIFDEETKVFWEERTESFRRKNKIRRKNEIKNENTSGKKGKFDDLPGIDRDSGAIQKNEFRPWSLKYRPSFSYSCC